MAKKRSALGSSPIDRVLAPPTPRDTRPARKKSATKKPKPSRKPDPVTEEIKTPSEARAKRVAHTFRLGEELLAECRAAVIALAGAPVRLTLSALVESALERELKRLKKKHNEGEDFPRFQGKLRAGRPIGS